MDNNFKNSAFFLISYLVGVFYALALIFLAIFYLFCIPAGPACGGPFAAILFVWIILGSLIIPIIVLIQLITLIVWLLKPIFIESNKVIETNKAIKSDKYTLYKNIFVWTMFAISIIYPILHYGLLFGFSKITS